MESWEKEVVFALDCEMIKVSVDGKARNMAARVVLVKCSPIFNSTGCTKVLDTYVYHEQGSIRDYLTKWSGIHPMMVQEGVQLNAVADFMLQLIAGHTLVTFSGHCDFAALGIDGNIVSRFAKKHVELQDYFKREDGRPYALGPLVDYFGYQRNGRQVIIKHNCVDDAVYTLRLYMDHYEADGDFNPSVPILTKSQYVRKYFLH